PVVTSTTAGINPFTVAVGDFNGDGKADMVTGDNDSFGYGDVSVFLGNGDGTFQASKSYQTAGGYPNDVIVADFNGDGKSDLETIDYSDGAVSVFIGNGNGTFKAAASFATGGGRPYGNAIGDINGDGKLDIVTSNNNHDVTVLLGNGDGTFKL